MSRRLHPCPSCAQHLRAVETRCPFCDAPLPAGFGASTSARDASDASGRPMSRAALLFFGATAAVACGGQTQASNPSEGGSDALAPVQDSGPSEASPDASTDAPSDATESEETTFWGWPPPTPDAQATSVAAYGPAPMPVSHYGPATVDQTSAATMYGPAAIDTAMPVANYGPAVTAEPSARSSTLRKVP